MMHKIDKETNCCIQSSSLIPNLFPHVYNNKKYSKSTNNFTNHVNLKLSPIHSKPSFDIDNYYDNDLKVLSKIMDNRFKSNSFKNNTGTIDLEMKPANNQNLFGNSYDKNNTKLKSKDGLSEQKK